MALDAFMYRDPMLVLQGKQELAAHKDRQCGSCTHHKTLEFKGELLHACEFKRKTYGKKCELFSTKGDK